MGYKRPEDGKWIIFNHLHMEVQYNKVGNRAQVVGFIVEPRSILNGYPITWDYDHGNVEP